jgi:hypothetical protein
MWFMPAALDLDIAPQGALEPVTLLDHGQRARQLVIGRDFRRPRPQSGAENADSDLENGDPRA